MPPLFLADSGYNLGMDNEDGFQVLLEQIRAKEKKLPRYGSVKWDGITRERTETYQFERNGLVEPDEVIRERALRFLEGLTPEERAVVEMEITFRDETPVRAIMKVQTGELSAERLKELRERAGLK